jgi:hypothetical protein
LLFTIILSFVTAENSQLMKGYVNLEWMFMVCIPYAVECRNSVPAIFLPDVRP